MKTSNIIIIGFFTFLLAGMLTLTISAKSHEKDVSKEYMEKANTNITKLPSFSVIVGQPGSVFHIQQSSDNRIEIKYYDKINLKSNAYRISNDTLYFSDSDKRVTVSYRIFCNNVNTVQGKPKSTVYIDSYISKSLKVSTDNGILFLSNENLNVKDYKNKVYNISIAAVNGSFVQVHKSIISSLDVELSTSRLEMPLSSVQSLKAILKERSTITNSSNPLNTQIIKDTSSYFWIN